MIVIMLSCLIYGYIHWEIVEASGKKESPDCETVPHFYTKLPTCVTVIRMYYKVLLNHLTNDLIIGWIFVARMSIINLNNFRLDMSLYL